MIKSTLSDIRKRYILRLICRCFIFLAAVILYLTGFEKHNILPGWAFFHKFSVLHLLWVVWLMDMLSQLIPMRKTIALGSYKVFRQRFKPALKQFSTEALKNHIVATTRSAYVVMLVWIALIGFLGLLKYWGILVDEHLFLVTVAFYVCDLICVLIWCPFRLMMGNKCCTTCRIFNWDHFMMFTPMVYVKGFYSWSLLGLSIVIWAVWELCVAFHPERFWEKSNAALKCSECTDKLCIQYCQKLRKK